MDFNVLYLLLIIVNIVILSVAMYFTWVRLEARGGRSLFLFLFTLLGFTAMYFCAQLVRRELAKGNMMIAAYGFIMLLPIFWTQLVYEMSGDDPEKAWHFNLPFGILNAAAFSSFIIKLPGVPRVLYYHTCNLNGPMFSCRVSYSLMYYISLSLILFELLGGIGWLLYSFFAQKHNEERARYLFLVLAVAFGSTSIYLAGVAFPNSQNNFDSLPIALSITTGLLMLAIFNRRLLTIRLGGDAQALIDDLLLVIDNDHYIQDVNMSLLQIFGFEIQSVVSTQLEVAFADHPKILNLFTQGIGPAETIELTSGEDTHYFEPTLSVLLDPQNSLPSGMRLQLHDVTDRHSTDSTAQGVASIVRDPLTNQYTRDSFFQFGGKLLSHTRTREQNAAIVVIDIDDFTLVNQRYSHLVGDQGLIQLVEIVNQLIRSTDLLARFQSDELVLLLPDADEYAAYQICTRIKDTVATHRFSFQSQEFQMTVSIGYTTIEPDDEYELEEIVDVAYQGLEQSHSLGRSRLTFLPVDIMEN